MFGGEGLDKKKLRGGPIRGQETDHVISGPMRGLETDHVISGPMRELKINFTGRGQTHMYTDITTL